MDLFKLVARLGMDSSDYEKGIAKARGSFSELGGFMGAKAVAIGNMISGAINKAANIASDLGSSAIQNAADVAAEKAQFQATFGELQGEAEKAFAGIEKSTGIFGTRLQNVGTKAFSQFKGAGLDGVDALTMMEEYTNLAADAAAYYDISLEDADARLRSFLRGNTEAGDAIGLFTSESQRNTAAIEKYGNKWNDLTEAQKQMLMLDISRDIYEQSGAIGQAARESDAWTNVIGNLKEAWRQATGVLGQPIIAVLTPVLQDVSDWLNEPETQKKIERFGLTVANVINWVLNPTFPTWEEVKEGSKETLDKINSGLETAINWALGKLGMPDAETIVADVKSWWTGQGNNAYERIKSVLSWTLGEFIHPKTEEVAGEMSEWWEDEGKSGILKVTDWAIGELYLPAWIDLVQGVTDWWDNKIKPQIKRIAEIDIQNIEFPSVLTMISKAKSWWAGVKAAIQDIFTISIQAHYGNTSYSGAGAIGTAEEGIDAISTPTMSVLSDAPRHAGGLYYARNNYIARLDEGEMILTQREANERRAGQEGGDAELLAEIRALRQDLMSRREVMTPDGRVLGEISYETVSQRIAQDAHSRRYRFG